MATRWTDCSGTSTQTTLASILLSRRVPRRSFLARQLPHGRRGLRAYSCFSRHLSTSPAPPRRCLEVRRAVLRERRCGWRVSIPGAGRKREQCPDLSYLLLYVLSFLFIFLCFFLGPFEPGAMPKPRRSRGRSRPRFPHIRNVGTRTPPTASPVLAETTSPHRVLGKSPDRRRRSSRRR